MRLGSIEVKRRVWVGLGCAVVVTVAWWAWTRRMPPAVATAPIGRQPFARLTGMGTATTDRVLRERADLFDPTPLFFPTEWNYGQQSLPQALRRQPGEVFGSFGPKPIISEDQSMKSFGVEKAPAPERLADVLAQGNEAPFAGMGHLDTPRAPLVDRVGFVEIRDFKDNKVIIGQLLTGLSLPRLDYAPLEFIVAVSSAGLVGDPVWATGSGWEEVDNFFRTYLVKTFRLGERLAPGRYRVLVGP